MWKWFNRWIWNPLGHVLRVRAIIQIWQTYTLWGRFAIPTVAAIPSIWRWWVNRDVPGAILIGSGILAFLSVAWSAWWHYRQGASGSRPFLDPMSAPLPFGSFLEPPAAERRSSL